MSKGALVAEQGDVGATASDISTISTTRQPHHSYTPHHVQPHEITQISQAQAPFPSTDSTFIHIEVYIQSSSTCVPTHAPTHPMGLRMREHPTLLRVGFSSPSTVVPCKHSSIGAVHHHFDVGCGVPVPRDNGIR